jgi:hypothetical protein
MPTELKAEWAEEYRQAIEEFANKREQWEEELRGTNKRWDSRPMWTQMDILEDLEHDWPTVKPLVIKHQDITMMNERVELLHKVDKRTLDIRSRSTLGHDTEFGVSEDIKPSDVLR